MYIRQNLSHTVVPLSGESKVQVLQIFALDDFFNALTRIGRKEHPRSKLNSLITPELPKKLPWLLCVDELHVRESLSCDV